MQTGFETTLTKKSVTVNLARLIRVRRILKVRSDSEALRSLVDKELILQGALKAHRRLRRGRITPVLWR